MAVQTRDFLAQLSPLAPINLGGGGQLDMERQRLELMRQQFEETKRQNQADNEYRKLAEASRIRQAELAIQKEREQQQALAAAENLKQRQQAIADMGKLYEARDFGGMSVAAERLNQLGGYARELNPGDPFPAWQVALEPPKPPPGLNPLDGLGYDTLGTGDSMPEADAANAEPLSTEEAFGRAGGVPTEAPEMPQAGDPTSDEPDALTSENLLPGGAATDQYGPPTARPAAPPAPVDIPGLTPGLTNFRPRRAPDAPDMTGGATNDVPTDVINTAALQYQQKQRLGPAMAAMAKSFPGAYQAQMGQANEAMLEAGLSPKDTMTGAAGLRQEVAGAIDKERGHEFKMAEQGAEANKPLTRPQEQEIAQKGFARARSTAKDRKIPEAVGTFAVADEIEQMLTGASPLGQERAINLLGQLNAQSKQQSDADAERLTGLNRASLITQVDQFLYQITNSGFNDEVKEAMLEFVQNIREHSKVAVHDWIESTAKEADSNPDPLVGRGMREYMNGLVGQRLLHEYMQETGDADEEEGSDDEEEGAESGPIPATSRIARVHNNPGNLKFVGQPGAEQGEPAAGGGHWAKFKTVEDGIAALRSQIERDAKAGLSVREFVTKYAPPTDGNDTETYIEQMAEALGAEADEALSGVDLDAALSFIAKKESSTRLPAKPKAGKGADDAKLLEGL